VTATLPTNWRENPKAAAETLTNLRLAKDKRTPKRVFASPGELAKEINPRTVQTAALELIDAELLRAYSTPDARLIISMPPQEGKSERATKTGTLWALLADPTRKVGIVSYSSDLARSFGRDIRNWIQDNAGQGGTLDLRLRLSADNNSAAEWSIDGYGGGVICRGIGAGLTGRAIDALIIDDPFADSEQAESETYRARVWDWWRTVGATRLAPGAPVIVIMTRWHEDDLAGRLLAAEDGALWRVVNIPAQADFDVESGGTDPLGREVGEWLSSARGRTVAQWESIKVRSGSRNFSALYQGQPSAESGNVWKRQWWRRYDTMLWSGASALTVECDEMIMSWDMTFKDAATSDFVVGQVWARVGAHAYLVDQIRRRLSFTDTVAAVKAMHEKWPQARTILVEDKANGTAVIDTLKAKIPGIVPVTPHESKFSRASAVAPYIESGNVHLPTAAVSLFAEVEDFINESASFPNDAHDDMVDAASQALARLYVDGAGAVAWLAYIDKQIADQTVSPRSAEVAAPLPDRETARQAIRRDF
jgi:predicted phage terminase large subunit-like protein